MALSANTKTIIVNEKGMASLFIVLSMVGLLTMVLLAQSGFGNSLNLQSLEKFQEDKSRLKKEISLVLGTISSCRNAMTHAGVAVFNSNESMVLRNPQQELIAAPNMHYSTVHIDRKSVV